MTVGDLNNPDRLAALRRTGLLDSERDPSFDRLTDLASRVLRAPVSLVSLVEAHRQFFKSRFGLSEPLATIRETPISFSFCQHVVATGEPLVISDARSNPRFVGHPAIEAIGVVAYLGIPLILPDGHVIGSFCVIDQVPRNWSIEDVRVMSDLAALVMTEIALSGELSRRNELNASLSARESHLSAIYEGALDAILIVDDRGRCQKTNPAACRMFGMNETEMLRRSCHDLAASGSDFAMAFAHLMQKGSARAECRTVRADGVLLDVEYSATANFVAGFHLMIFRDITDRKRMEIQLSQSNQKVTNILESITDAFVTLDADWRLTYANTQARLLFPSATGEVIGRSFWEFFPVASHERTFQNLVRANADGVAVHFDKYFSALDRWLSVHAFPGVDGLSIYFADITERVRSAAMKETESRVHAIVEASLDPYIAFDEQGRITAWNHQAEVSLGWSSDEVLGRSFFDTILPCDHRDHFREDHGRFMETGSSRILSGRHEMEILCKDGSCLPVEIRFAPIPWGDAIVFGVFLNDISGRQREARARALLWKQALNLHEEQTRKLSRDLHDGVCQDLSTLVMGLHAIKTATSLERVRNLCAQFGGLAASAADEVRRLAGGLRPSVLDDLGLEAALERLVHDVSAVHDLTIDLTMDDPAPTRIPQEVETCLYRMVQESLTNVVKHAKANRVQLHLHRDPVETRFLLRDDGCGFDSQTLPSLTHGGKHFGLLGMSERAALLNGNVQVDSAPGHGTTILVRLPHWNEETNDTDSHPDR